MGDHLSVHIIFFKLIMNPAFDSLKFGCVIGYEKGCIRFLYKKKKKSLGDVFPKDFIL